MSELSIPLVVIAVVVAVQAVALLGLARMVGLLYRRIPPAGAPQIGLGPELGHRVPSLVGGRIDSDEVFEVIPDTPLSHRRLLVYMSPICQACDEVAPAVRTVHAKEPNTDVVILATKGTASEWDGFTTRRKLRGIPVVSMNDLPLDWQVDTSPYAMLIGESGEIVVKGIVNRIEHIDSLFDFADANADQPVKVSAGPSTASNSLTEEGSNR